MNIAIAGMGLIGGSFAKAIKKYTNHNVFVWNRTAATAEKAVSEGAADGLLDNDTLGGCDLVILCLYPELTIEWVKERAPYINKGAVVTDTCGVKRVICDALEPVAENYGFTFIGGHPMAGRELSGYEASLPELFQGASMILTTPQAPEIWKNLADELGFAGVKCTTPEEHDRMIAFTSQLAHIVSGAYVKSPNALNHKGFSAGSFKDLTRVAYLNENMWTELFLDNRDMLEFEISNIIKELEKYRDALEKGDAEELKAILKEGRERKEQTL